MEIYLWGAGLQPDPRGLIVRHRGPCAAPQRIAAAVDTSPRDSGRGGWGDAVVYRQRIGERTDGKEPWSVRVLGLPSLDSTARNQESQQRDGGSQ
jgi:hypothetical protein